MLKDLRPALRSFLLGDPAISSIVGTRVYPSILPSGSLPGPSIVYNLISEDTDYHLKGASGLVFTRYQLDSWAASNDAATDLSLKVKERLQGFQGDMNGITVRGVFSEIGRSIYDGTAQLHNASRDFFFGYLES